MKLSRRNPLGHSAFFIPPFVLNFLAALEMKAQSKFLFLDSYQSPSKLPAINPHDINSSARADIEKDGMIKYTKGEIELSDFLLSLTKETIKSLKDSSSINSTILVSPFFAYMPYIQPLWNFPLSMCVDISQEVKQSVDFIRKFLRRDAANTTTAAPEDLMSSDIQSSSLDLKSIPKDWVVDSEHATIVAKLKNDTDGTCLRSFMSSLGQSDYAVVSVGLVDSEGIVNQAPNFIIAYYSSRKEFNVCHFVTTAPCNDEYLTEEQTSKLTLTFNDFLAYLNMRGMILSTSKCFGIYDKQEGSILQTSNGPLHVGDNSLYALDLPMEKELGKLFLGKLCSTMKNMLPSGRWCLTDVVSLCFVLVSFTFVKFSHLWTSLKRMKNQT